VFNHFGYNLPRTTYEQANCGTAIDPNDSSKWMPGDLLFYYPSAQGPEHVGIYVGNGQKLHAPQTGQKVCINPAGHPCAVRRIIK
jgi:cell wall-associated NlpC family hydrolase